VDVPQVEGGCVWLVRNGSIRGDWIATNPMFAARLKVKGHGRQTIWAVQRGPSITLDYLFHSGLKQAVVVLVGPSASIWV
jgi:hypothetical protein